MPTAYLPEQLLLFFINPIWSSKLKISPPATLETPAVANAMARQAEFTEMSFLSIAAETAAIERQSAADAAIGNPMSNNVICHLTQEDD
jgi:hypothetical protein